MKASIHPHQAKRLATLHSYDILDTPRESDFDDIAQLAAKFCGVPISVINLIDGERQWFKAEVGLGARETPLETSICSHVILGQDFTIIEDTHKDPRTADNELCTPSDGLRFYAGALLKADNGMPIGTLCVLDTKPSTLDEDQRQALQVLARRVMRELDLRRTLRAQNVLQDEMDHRVKNSLTSIASAIRLYKRDIQSTDDADAAFGAVERHLDAVAAVHEAINLSKDVGEIELRSYMTVLAEHLEVSLPMDISVTADAPEHSIPPKVASTLGLIANEFAANTVKHGQSEVAQAQINYTLQVQDGQLTMVCRNNVPELHEADVESRRGIGARLMQASVAQHGGQLQQESSAAGYVLTAMLSI